MNSPYSSFPVTGLKGAALLSSPVQSAASSGVASPDSAENGSLEQAESGSLVAVSLVCRNRSHPHRLRESDHQRAEQPVLSPLPHTLCLGSQQASAGPFPHAYPSRTGEASAPKAGRPDRCRSPQDAHRDDAPLEQSTSPRATSATALTPHRQLGPVQVAYKDCRCGLAVVLGHYSQSGKLEQMSRGLWVRAVQLLKNRSFQDAAFEFWKVSGEAKECVGCRNVRAKAVKVGLQPGLWG